MFGNYRLSNTQTPEAEAAITSVLEAIAKFQGGKEHFDDETLVVLRVR